MNSRASKRIPDIITPSAGDTSLPEPMVIGNGLPVYLLGNGTEELLRVEFVFHAGQAMEEIPLSASAANAMLTEGTTHHDVITLNDLIDSTGAALTHAADKDTAGLVTVTLTRKLDEVMALAHEVLFAPSFPENEFRMLTEKRLQAFQTSRQKTSVIARETFYESLCGSNNPYGRITREDDYRALTTGDLRRFHGDHYRPGNFYVTVAGREPEKAVPVLEKYFSGIEMIPFRNDQSAALPLTQPLPERYSGKYPDRSRVRSGWAGRGSPAIIPTTSNCRLPQ